MKCFFKFLLIGIIFCIYANAKESSETYNIVLAVLKDNPDYYSARTAFINYLNNQTDTYEFRLIHSNGNLKAYEKGLNQINKDIIDLVFTTGTRSTLPAKKIINDIPIVFTAVAAPIKSGIISNLADRKENITGTHCSIPIEKQILAIKTIFPKVKKIGIVYTEGESNAEIQTQDFFKSAKNHKLDILISTVSNQCNSEKEVYTATLKLVNKVDLILAHQDTSLSKYGRGMIEVATKNKIPTYVTLNNLISEGAILSVGINFKQLGKISGQQAFKILKNKIPASKIPIQTYPNYSLIINFSAAKKIGYKISNDSIQKANSLIN